MKQRFPARCSMPPLEQDIPFKCIELISNLALPELTATMRRTARTPLVREEDEAARGRPLGGQDA